MLRWARGPVLQPRRRVRDDDEVKAQESIASSNHAALFSFRFPVKMLRVLDVFAASGLIFFTRGKHEASKKRQEAWADGIPSLSSTEDPVMHWTDLSRRLFLQRSCAGIGSTWLASRWTEILAAQEHAHRAALAAPESKLEIISSGEAAEIEAVAAQIIPTDSTAGAREAHVIYFIDRALATFDGDKRQLYARGLRELQSRSRKLFRGSRRFSDLTADQQIEVLKSIEKTQFFEMVRKPNITCFL